MSKKQTVFLSAILGIGSIMMLSFLIISAIKADTTGCTVSNDLAITGSTTIGSGLSVAGSAVITNNLTAYGNTTLGDATTDSTTISGDLSAGGSLTVMGNTTLGDATTDSTTVSGDLSVGDDLSFNGEIEPDGSTCSDGQILKKTGADNWDCVDPEIGSLSCSTVINNTYSCDTSKCTVRKSCGTGYVMTGGGCFAMNTSGAYMPSLGRPTDSNGWTCVAMKEDLDSLKVYTRCCKVE